MFAAPYFPPLVRDLVRLAKNQTVSIYDLGILGEPEVVIDAVIKGLEQGIVHPTLRETVAMEDVNDVIDSPMKDLPHAMVPALLQTYINAGGIRHPLSEAEDEDSEVPTIQQPPLNMQYCFFHYTWNKPPLISFGGGTKNFG